MQNISRKRPSFIIIFGLRVDRLQRQQQLRPPQMKSPDAKRPAILMKILRFSQVAQSCIAQIAKKSQVLSGCEASAPHS
jgi:hypothetical protein